MVWELRTDNTPLILILSTFSHDPRSGLDGVLLEVEQGAAGNALHYHAKQHLLGQAERLNVGSLASAETSNTLNIPV
jgi:hypothetical protein